MEGAPVTAATGVLGPVIVKLGALLGSQYRLRRRTRKDVQFIKSKLKSVHSILWRVWEKEDLDAESKFLRKEALDLAADMDDAIDDFILTMERSRRNKHLMVQIKIEASPFQDFKTRVNVVSGRCRSKWKNKSAEPFSSLFSRKNDKSSPRIPPAPRAPFVCKDASELVGMGRWKDDLIRYLLQEENIPLQPQLKMASVVGMAGVGKTTLANLVYEEIGNKFQSRAFVSVTSTPNMKEVLTSILQQVVGAQSLAEAKTGTEEQIIHTLSNFLDDKRYLVIIDDIWHRGEWEVISKSFPENNQGSRIIMTTRIHSLLGDDFNNRKICVRMNPEWSFVQGDNYKNFRWLYGPDKEDVSTWMKPDMVGEGFDCDHPMVRMCGSVPLALLCMFSAMAVLREQQEQHVETRCVQDMLEKQVKRSGIHNTQGFQPLVESLQLGYDDLPHHMLKTSLLYCSIYPDNYHFKMDDLVMRWVAEGFIYNEDIAKGYFEELHNRGLMLPSQSICGAFQMNPMMRNFLRWKSREDNFITCSSDITSAYAHRIHRLCIDNYPVDDGAVEGVDPLFELDWSQIRSLVVSEGIERDVPFEKLESVRVLDFHFKGTSALGNDHVKDIFGLLRLRHLFGLEGVGINEIPPEIARLQCLETLQLKRTSIRELPREIGDLQQLKTLDMSFNEEQVNNTIVQTQEIARIIGEMKQWRIPTGVAREIENAHMMLKTFNVLEELAGTPNMQELKTPDMSGNEELADLTREIGDVQQTETPNPSLNLGLSLTSLPREIGKLQHLKTLKLYGAHIMRLPIEIGNLRNLETLDLSHNRRLIELPCGTGNLQNLKRLVLTGTRVEKVPREIGGLKKLENLETNGIFQALPWPWEASQLSKLRRVPECIRQALKNSHLMSCVLDGEILSIQLDTFGDQGGLIIGTKHMHIPWWIKDHFNDLGSLDIRICKLEEQDLKILREMPSLVKLTVRLEVVPREPIAISGEGFRRLIILRVDSRCVPHFTFQEGAMPWLGSLCFEFQFYGGPPSPANKDPPVLGINNLRRLVWIYFSCNALWYGRAAESSPCISAMIDVARKEAQEHPNEISISCRDSSSKGELGMGGFQQQQ